MTIKRKLLALSLALILALSFVFVSCANEPTQTLTSSTTTTTSPPTGLSAQEIAFNVITASTKLDVCKLNMDMAMTAEAVGGTDPGKMTMLMNTSGYVNTASKEMTLTMDMNMDIPGQGKQDMSVEMYIVGGWVYMKMNVPQAGEQWIKMKLTDELWGQFYQEFEFLETAIDVTLLGSENVDGVDCYVLEITPNMAELTKWVMSQSQSQQTGIDLSKLDLSKLFKSISVKEWAAKDSFMPIKEDISLVMEMRPEDMGATAEDFEKMTINLSGQIKFYDYGKKVSIQLPEGALNAQEMPSQ